MNSRFVKNTSWIVGGHVIKLLISFAVGLLTARYLGPTNMGMINYVSAYMTFATAIIGLGINEIIVNEFLNHPEDEGKVLGTALFIRLVLGIICSVSVVVLMNSLYEDNYSLRIVAILQAIQLPFLCLDTIQYLYQAHLQSKYSVIAQTIAHILTSAYKVILLITNKEVEWFAFATSLDIIILGIAYWVTLKRKNQIKLSFSRSFARDLLRKCIPFLLTSLMIVIYGQTDKIMIREITRSDTQVGLYSVAVVICGMIGFIPSAIIDSSRPLVFEARRNTRDEFLLRFRQMTGAVIWICILYSAFVCVFADFILNTLYGAEYAAAENCLRICVWYTAFSYVGSAKSIWLISENKNKYVFVFAVIGACTNILLNLLLIPIMGISGAALATLITQLVTNVFSPLLFSETREYTRLVFQSFVLKGVRVRSILNSVTKGK